MKHWLIGLLFCGQLAWAGTAVEVKDENQNNITNSAATPARVTLVGSSVTLNPSSNLTLATGTNNIGTVNGSTVNVTNNVSVNQGGTFTLGTGSSNIGTVSGTTLGASNNNIGGVMPMRPSQFPGRTYVTAQFENGFTTAGGPSITLYNVTGGKTYYIYSIIVSGINNTTGQLRFALVDNNTIVLPLQYSGVAVASATGNNAFFFPLLFPEPVQFSSSVRLTVIGGDTTNTSKYSVATFGYEQKHWDSTGELAMNGWRHQALISPRRYAWQRDQE